jgi:nitrous oxide reductase accessory protein NosL
MNQRTTKLVTAILAAECLAAGCAQGSNGSTALPTFPSSRDLSVSPPTGVVR